MSYRRLLVLSIILLASTTLAGCLDEDDPVKTTVGTDPTPPPAGNGTPAPEPTQPTEKNAGPNRSPRAEFVASTTNGATPLAVTFRINATDPDNDTLTWRLDIDADGRYDYEGQELPANQQHTFEEAGEHLVVLNVTDGKSEVEGNLTIQVREPAPPPRPEPVVIHDNITGLYIGTPVTDGQYLFPEGNNHTWDLEVAVDTINVTITWDEHAADLDIFVYAPDGTRAGFGSNYNEPTGTLYENSEPPVLITDPKYTQQLGSWAVRVASAGSVESSYTVTIAFE